MVSVGTQSCSTLMLSPRGHLSNLFFCCSVARTVDPKRKKVAESEKNLRLAQKELAKIKVSFATCSIQHQHALLQHTSQCSSQSDTCRKRHCHCVMQQQHVSLMQMVELASLISMAATSLMLVGRSGVPERTTAAAA